MHIFVHLYFCGMCICVYVHIHISHTRAHTVLRITIYRARESVGGLYLLFVFHDDELEIRRIQTREIDKWPTL